MRIQVDCGNWQQASKIELKYREEGKPINKIGNTLYIRDYKGTVDDMEKEFNLPGMKAREFVSPKSSV